MRKKTVLVCDDDGDTLEALALALCEEGKIEVVRSQTGIGVLDYLRVAPLAPDLLIVDLMLPDLEGDDVIQIIKKSPQFRGIPIILMSGIIENVQDRAHLVGANDYLSKPFLLRELQDKVEALI